MNNFTDAPPHFGKSLANQELEWLPSDTKERYEELIKDPKHLEYFQKLGWDKPGAITYKINSHGFRCDEFEPGDYLVTLGCSYTAGIGLPVDVLWPTLVGKELGLRVANLAWGGYSADTCFRLATYWIPKLAPKLVVMLSPPSARIEILFDNASRFEYQPPDFDVYIPSFEGRVSKSYDNYLKHWFLNDENARINELKNKLALQQFCANLGIPCQVHYANNIMSGDRNEIGYARDYLHGGIEAHQRIAEVVINEHKK
jgi:hypothetical protein